MLLKNRRGTLFVISGPSGVGKGTILSEILRLEQKIIFSVSATTRSPRPGEIDGKDYFFITFDEFKKLIEEEKFLEYAFVHGNYYGTLESFVDENLKKGYDVILDIDVQGAMQVMKKRKDGVFIFIAPPNMDIEILKMRLLKRSTEPLDVIEKRIQRAKDEIKAVYQYEYLIFNDVLEEAVKDLLSIIRACRLRVEKIIQRQI